MTIYTGRKRKALLQVLERALPQTVAYLPAASTYLDARRKELDTTSYDSLLDSMALTYATMYTNMTIDERVQTYLEIVSKYNADGFNKPGLEGLIIFETEGFERRIAPFAPKERIGTPVFDDLTDIPKRFFRHMYISPYQKGAGRQSFV